MPMSRVETSRGKPHPEMFLTAADELGVRPADAVVIEDAAAGVEAAKAGAMAAIGIAAPTTQSCWRLRGQTSSLPHSTRSTVMPSP